MADIACGGWVRKAAMSRANTRWWAASSATISSGSGSAPARTADSASVTGINAKTKLPKPKLPKPKLLNSERSQRVSDVVGRCHVNADQALRLRPLDVLGEIVEEHDAGGGRADRLHHMIIGCRVRFPKPDRRRQKDFTEMAEQGGISCREMFDMGTVGIGEDIKRQAFSGTREQLGHARHFADEDRVPAVQELGIR